jgi:hypothetical protein
VVGYEHNVEGRKHVNIAEIRNDKSEVLARSTGTFIAIDPEKMFAQLGRAAGLGGPSAAGTKA